MQKIESAQFSKTSNGSTFLCLDSPFGWDLSSKREFGRKRIDCMTKQKHAEFSALTKPEYGSWTSILFILLTHETGKKRCTEHHETLDQNKSVHICDRKVTSCHMSLRSAYANRGLANGVPSNSSMTPLSHIMNVPLSAGLMLCNLFGHIAARSPAHFATDEPLAGCLAICCSCRGEALLSHLTQPVGPQRRHLIVSCVRLFCFVAILTAAVSECQSSTDSMPMTLTAAS